MANSPSPASRPVSSKLEMTAGRMSWHSRSAPCIKIVVRRLADSFNGD